MPSVDVGKSVLVFVYIMVVSIFSITKELDAFPEDSSLDELPRFIKGQLPLWGVSLSITAWLFGFGISGTKIIFQVTETLIITFQVLVIMIESILLDVVIRNAKAVRRKELELKNTWLMDCPWDIRERIRAETIAKKLCSLCGPNYKGIHIPQEEMKERLNPNNPDNRVYKEELFRLWMKGHLIGILGHLMLVIAFLGIILEFPAR